MPGRDLQCQDIGNHTWIYQENTSNLHEILLKQPSSKWRLQEQVFGDSFNHLIMICFIKF